MLLKNKIAIVTGSSRGIGKAIAIKLGKKGANVIITYKKQQKMAEMVKNKLLLLGVKAISLQVDISQRKSICYVIKRTLNRFGKIDILINNAAIAQEKPFEKITNEDWDKMMVVNLRGPFAFSQEVLPYMKKQKQGRIVNITSIGGQWGGFNQVHYAAAKAGLINFTRSLAKIYSKYNITTNAVAPGLVLTDMSKKELKTVAGKKKVMDIPINRIADPEEVANIVAFLCSDEASYVTGQTINVNGGMYFG